MSDSAAVPEVSKVKAFFVGLAIMVGLLMIGGWIVSMIFGAMFHGPAPLTDTQRAQFACKDLATNELKAPSTASFGVMLADNLGGGEWSVTGTVDAENGFGAKIRGSVVCDLHQSGTDFTGTASVG